MPKHKTIPALSREQMAENLPHAVAKTVELLLVAVESLSQDHPGAKLFWNDAIRQGRELLELING